MPALDDARDAPMKRPRRPTKKTVRKVVRKKTAQRDRLIKKVRKVPIARLNEDGKTWTTARPQEQYTPAQAALFERPKPRKGFAYQWAHVDNLDDMLAAGWDQVHYSRHPEMPRSTNFAGYIVVTLRILPSHYRPTDPSGDAPGELAGRCEGVRLEPHGICASSRPADGHPHPP